MESKENQLFDLLDLVGQVHIPEEGKNVDYGLSFQTTLSLWLPSSVFCQMIKGQPLFLRNYGS